MSVISGTTNGSIKSTSINIPCTLKCLSLYNKTGGAGIVKVGVVVSGTDRYMFSFNLAAMGSAGSSAYQETDIIVPKLAQILIVTNVEIDYYLTIS